MLLHEFAHYLACKLTGTKVLQVQWFGREAFVKHEKPAPFPSILITLAPFLFGSLLGFLLLYFAVQYFAGNVLVSLVLLWLAVSTLFFAFPSSHDSRIAFHSTNAFFKERILGRGTLQGRLVWVLLFPFLYLPLMLLLGVLLLFDLLVFLRLLWIAFLLFMILAFPA